MPRLEPVRRVAALSVVLSLGLAGCGEGAADLDLFCEVNEVEGFIPTDFPPAEAGLNVPTIVFALRRPMSLFDFEDVGSFAQGFREFLRAAPGEIRPSIEVLAAAFEPVFEWAANPELPMTEGELESLTSPETTAAGFAVEDWVYDNCSA